MQKSINFIYEDTEWFIRYNTLFSLQIVKLFNVHIFIVAIDFQAVF